MITVDRLQSRMRDRFKIAYAVASGAQPFGPPPPAARGRRRFEHRAEGGKVSGGSTSAAFGLSEELVAHCLIAYVTKLHPSFNLCLFSERLQFRIGCNPVQAPLRRS